MAQKGLRASLATFAKEKSFRGKGPLCVALVVTRHAMKYGLPLDPDALVTRGGGQVLGLGKRAVQSVLEEHGIVRVLAAEGGRTSRGSLRNMREYVNFLNALGEEADLDAIETFWIDRVKKFFAARPFRLRLDASRSLRTVIRDVVDQALERQRESGGTNYAGAVLQHLVGAKLDCALGVGKFTHNSFSTADAPSGRSGDFVIGDVAIHVTTSPGEALIERCQGNLDSGNLPMLVTVDRGMPVAVGLATNKGVEERIDIFEIEQFVALNLYELGQFKGVGRKTALNNLVSRYNEIVEEFETDPSLKIEIRR